MFFRRMFQRKDSDDNDNNNDNDNTEADDELANYYEPAKSRAMQTKKPTHHKQANFQQQPDFQLHRNGAASSTPRAQRKFGHSKHSSSAATSRNGMVGATSASAAVQLTPLWEHILRTRTLPENICPQKMFTEFLERLRDPEWQVRQHALRVFVDVLVVMRAMADAYMDPLIGQLVENLGHPAPTVRKGALDCLRVYLSETAMPETIMLHILDIGLNQKITNEPFGGRLTCGVMLSLPALVQSTLHTTKRHFILRSTIELLVQKMGQVTHQEITLKVLSKIRELIGEEEFVEFLSHGAYREFELLCKVYGVGEDGTIAASGQELQRAEKEKSAWRLITHKPASAADTGWRFSEGEQLLQEFSEEPLKLNKNDKIIMETEIKINDDTLTMRILEAKDDDSICGDSCADDANSRRTANSTYPNSLEDDVVCGRLVSARNSIDSAGIIQLLSDSEVEEIYRSRSNSQPYESVVTPSTPSRTPKRVTFGGEIVKMRTPDSDGNTSNNNQNNKTSEENLVKKSIENNAEKSSTASKAPIPVDITPEHNKINPLSLEIPNDNTKPLLPSSSEEEQSKPSIETTIPSNSPRPITTSSAPTSPVRQKDGTGNVSPRSPFKRINISPVDSIISPKVPHKEIEVLHNLQRDPSPVRSRRSSIRLDDDDDGGGIELAKVAPIVNANESQATARKKSAGQESKISKPSVPPPPPKSWEDLGIVDDDVLMDLRAGDWRLRSHGIGSLEEALRSSDNLARVQPCLDSLLRVLLSSERNPEVAENKRRLLMNLISRLPLDNLEDRTMQIMTGLCRQGGAGANRVCKTLMQRLPPAVIVLKLISDEFLHAKSSRFREQALQMVMYALMTFPSTCFDTTTCVTNATYAALDRKKRVRQAALDVLAILGQVSSARSVLEVIQGIAAMRDEGPALLAAVKARLGRKQLPLVTADGMVQYALRIPSPSHIISMEQNESGLPDTARLDADIEWINAGVGSVSPSSMKRRAAARQRSSSQQSFSCLPSSQDGSLPSASGSNNSDDSYSKRNSSRVSRERLLVKEGAREYLDDTQPHNIQYVLGSSAPLHFGTASKKSNVDFTNYVNRRLVAKSCSDSSMDGRSSDSTYTSSSGGGGAAAAAAVANGNGISGRFTRQAVHSRFPSMDRMDMNATYVRVHKPPVCYPGMGAYAQLQQQQYNMNATYPKVNYTLSNAKRRGQNMQQQQQQQQQHYHQHQKQQQQLQLQPQQQQQQHYYHQQHTLNQLQQQQQHQRNLSSQETFKQQENQFNERNSRNNHNNNNNNNIGNSINNNTANNNEENLDGTYTICSGPSGVIGNDIMPLAMQHHQQQQQQHQQTNHNQFANANSNGNRRFVNVEKFIQQSNKYSQTNGAQEAIMPKVEDSNTKSTGTPGSTKSSRASTKGTPTSLRESPTVSARATTSTRATPNSTKSSPTSSKSISHSLKTSVSTTPSTKSLESVENIVANAVAATTERNPSPKSNNNNEADLINCSTPTTTLVGNVQSAAEDNEVGSESPAKWSIVEEELQVEEYVDAQSEPELQTDINDAVLERKASLLSLQSRTESIHTQLDDVPSLPSRPHSSKSVVIEEDIEDTTVGLIQDEEAAAGGDFMTIEKEEEDIEAKIQNEGQRVDISDAEALVETDLDQPDTAFGSPQNTIGYTGTPLAHRPTRERSPTIAELKSLSRRTSMIKSMESLYNRSPSPKHEDPLDNATETSSSTSSTSSQIHPNVDNFIPVKPQHTPLKQKAKTSHFLKASSNRRISPIRKRSINIAQAELYPQSMTRFERPRDALLKSFDQLDSTNWEVNVLGLKALVRLMRYHPETLDNNMHMVCIQLTKTVRNLRSQVARAACVAATEIFGIKSKILEQECDDLVCGLLHRTADTNRFLRADAMRALESMCDQLTPAKVLNILTTKGAQHQHALVRTSTAKLLNRLVERLGCDKVYNMSRDQRDKFFVTGANLLLEGSLDTRSYAKTLFKQLSAHPSYHRLLLEVIPTRTYRNVEKTLKSIRKDT